jgi:VWFA-related protein
MMNNRLRLAAWLTAATLAVTPVLMAQEPAATFGDMTEVTEVLLDVLVTDKQGNVIVGLTEDDFIVEEDAGAPIEVTGATFYSNRRFVESEARAKELGLSFDAVPVDRFFVLFFHDQRQDLSQLTGQQLDAARYAKQWVDRELLVNDYVAVVSYDVGLKVQTDFTNDKETLKKAIGDAVISRDPGKNYPSRFPPEDQPSLLRSLPTGKALGAATWDIHHGLRLVAEALGDTIGRKNMLLFSIGWGVVDEAVTFSPDVRYYDNTMQAMNASNVAVYAIDYVSTLEGGGSLDRTLNDSLSNLAKDTGGQYFFQYINFATPLTEVSEDTNGYYLLSYPSLYQQGTSGFRNVKVRTRNADFEVRTRKGYAYGST